jgi:hypothetical protein
MQDLVEKPGRKRPHVITTHGWEYNLKMDLPEIEGGHRLIDWVQYREKWQPLVNKVMKI